jgi:hypothetical protein
MAALENDKSLTRPWNRTKTLRYAAIAILIFNENVQNIIESISGSTLATEIVKKRVTTGIFCSVL